nr:hypothetical protein BaRGS_025333 [Batillaria attramentaria]
MTFKEQMKQQILQSAKLMNENAAASSAENGSKPENVPERPNMPLNPANLYGRLATSSAGCGIMGGGNVTPQMAFLHTVAALHKQAQEITGVEVPKYYNPAAVNPLKYAEQVQKRKLLWSKAKDKKETNSQWNAQAVVVDGDSKTQAKFKKLMGIKESLSPEGQQPEASGSGEVDVRAQEQRQKQEELFHQLDREYEFAPCQKNIIKIHF